MPSPSSTSRTPASAAHSCSAEPVPGGQHHVPDPGAGRQRVALGQVGQVQPAEPADPAAVRGAQRR